MSTCSDGSQRVAMAPHDIGEVGRINILVDHDDDTAHIALRGGYQRGALRMSSITLLERHDGH
jgi:hypothetical protein